MINKRGNEKNSMCTECGVEPIFCDESNLCIPCLISGHQEVGKQQFTKRFSLKNKNQEIPTLNNVASLEECP